MSNKPENSKYATLWARLAIIAGIALGVVTGKMLSIVVFGW